MQSEVCCHPYRSRVVFWSTDGERRLTCCLACGGIGTTSGPRTKMVWVGSVDVAKTGWLPKGKKKGTR